MDLQGTDPRNRTHQPDDKSDASRSARTGEVRHSGDAHLGCLHSRCRRIARLSCAADRTGPGSAVPRHSIRWSSLDSVRDCYRCVRLGMSDLPRRWSTNCENPGLVSVDPSAACSISASTVCRSVANTLRAFGAPLRTAGSGNPVSADGAAALRREVVTDFIEVVLGTGRLYHQEFA